MLAATRKGLAADKRRWTQIEKLNLNTGSYLRSSVFICGGHFCSLSLRFPLEPNIGAVRSGQIEGGGHHESKVLDLACLDACHGGCSGRARFSARRKTAGPLDLKTNGAGGAREVARLFRTKCRRPPSTFRFTIWCVFYSYKGAVSPVGFLVERSEGGNVWLWGKGGTERRMSSSGISLATYGIVCEWLPLRVDSKVEWEAMDSTLFRVEHAFSVFLRTPALGREKCSRSFTLSLRSSAEPQVDVPTPRPHRYLRYLCSSAAVTFAGAAPIPARER